MVRDHSPRGPVDDDYASARRELQRQINALIHGELRPDSPDPDIRDLFVELDDYLFHIVGLADRLVRGETSLPYILDLAPDLHERLMLASQSGNERAVAYLEFFRRVQDLARLAQELLAKLEKHN